MKINELREMKIWAVVGSVHNPEKYAYKIYNFLKRKGYVVYAVDPTGEMVDEDNSYTSLKLLPQKPEAIDMVIHPSKAETFISEARELGIKNIWFQPGAESSDLIERLSGEGFEVVHHRCVMVEF